MGDGMTRNDPTVKPDLLDGMGATIFYDGECPVCANYVVLVKLREAVGPVKLVNVRHDEEARMRLERLGYDLDEGMILEYRHELYHGASAVHMMAALSNRGTIFNRLNWLIFRSAAQSRRLYPFMRAGRNTLLRLLGRESIAASARKSRLGMSD
jgi:predicted DCC family thiol-disulfide oxidoreductase YuxK